MQDSESMVKAMKAIAAQAKAIAEEFQVDESVALQILEDACGGASAVVRWALSASEAQGTGCKCGEGACKAKEEAQAPAPVRKPTAPEAAPKTAAEIWLQQEVERMVGLEPEAAPEATDEIWDTDLDKIWVGSIKIGSQNRVTIPLRIIEQAERINGTLKSKRHKFGALTVIKGDGKATVLFGDKSAEHEGSRVVHLNCNGQAQFRVSPVFLDGEAVECFLFKDGAIVFTMIDE